MMIDTPRSSFIPKESPGMVPGRVKRRRTFHVFGFLATALVIGSMLLAGGVLFLKNASSAKLDSAKIALSEQSAQFKDEHIAEIREFDRKLRAAKLLLDNHVSPLKVFAALERSTKVNVQLIDFTFTHDPGFEALLTISGGTETFVTLALQEEQFDQNIVLADVLFKELGVSTNVPNESGASTNSETTTSDLNFGFSGTLDLSSIRYDGVPTQVPAVLSATARDGVALNDAAAVPLDDVTTQ